MLDFKSITSESEEINWCEKENDYLSEKSQNSQINNYKVIDLEEDNESTRDQTPIKYDAKEKKNVMKNKGNIGKNKYNGKNKDRKDLIGTKIRRDNQEDIHKVCKNYLKPSEKLEKINYEWFIKQDSGFINRVIFSKSIKEFLLLNKDNQNLINKLEIRQEQYPSLKSLLNKTYLQFISEIFKPNNEYKIDSSKYEIQKKLGKDGYIGYIFHKKDRKLLINRERDKLLNIEPKI